jgi:hypothetical protein
LHSQIRSYRDFVVQSGTRRFLRALRSDFCSRREGQRALGCDQRFLTLEEPNPAGIPNAWQIKLDQAYRRGLGASQKRAWCLTEEGLVPHRKGLGASQKRAWCLTEEGLVPHRRGLGRMRTWTCLPGLSPRYPGLMSFARAYKIDL